jgi:hypothetical protein
MAYFIFLKSLRSLGEFRKNPHVKIPPKSPCANFQSIGKFRNSIFIRKEIFFNFRPNQPSGQLAHPAFWPRAARQAEPAHPTESSPLLLPPSLYEPAVPLPPLTPWAPCRPSPAPWSDHNGRAPLLNLVMCLYSDINTPPLYCV